MKESQKPVSRVTQIDWPYIIQFQLKKILPQSEKPARESKRVSSHIFIFQIHLLNLYSGKLLLNNLYCFILTCNLLHYLITYRRNKLKGRSSLNVPFKVKHYFMKYLFLKTMYITFEKTLSIKMLVAPSPNRLFFVRRY